MDDGELIGNLDGVADGCLFGWAYDRRDGGRMVDVDLIVDGVRVLTVPADDYRGESAGGRNRVGHHAFSVEVPLRLMTKGPLSRESALRRHRPGPARRSLACGRARGRSVAARAQTCPRRRCHRRGFSPCGDRSAGAADDRDRAGKSGDFESRFVLSGPNGIIVETLAHAMPEPAAPALSLPFGRIYPWGAVGDRPGRIMDASFQFFEPKEYLPAPRWRRTAI